MIRLSDDITFLSHDLHLLESLEFKQRIKHVAEIIEEIKWEDIDPDMLTRYAWSSGLTFYTKQSKALLSSGCRDFFLRILQILDLV